jgi:protoporphyrinogen oxidase
MKKKYDIVILGAGISGCAAAQELQARSVDYILLEKNIEPGGLTRSISIGDVQFDYTGHYLHLSKVSDPEDLPYAKQKNEDWQLIERKSVIFLEDTIVPAPFQYNISALPRNIRNQSIMDYYHRPRIRNPRSLRDFLISGFGESICEHFLFPYSEKQMAISIDKLSIDAVSRFFPYPDRKNIEEGFKRKNTKAKFGYNSHFWYPKKNTIGLLSKGIADGLENLCTCCDVKKIDTNKKLVYTTQGKIGYNVLVSSIPLKILCKISNHSELYIIADKLNHNKVLCLNMYFNKPFSNKFEGCHWIYIPDQTVPFYRIGIYSNISSICISAARSAIYVELAYSDYLPPSDINAILSNVFFFLERFNWAFRKDCLIITANWIDCAYVHFTNERKEALPKIFNILEELKIYPIGRYGLWDYISMEDSIFSGINVAKRASYI